MSDLGLRTRIERLLRGDFRPDDLSTLILYARQHSDGRECIREIGHFIAHQDKRERGIVSETTRDWYFAVQFAIPAMRGGFDWRRLPEEFPAFLQATVRRAPTTFFKNTLHITRAEAWRRLPSIIKKFIRNGDSTLSLSPSHSRDELRLIQVLATQLVAAPAFTGDQLFNEFAAIMRSNGLLHKNEEREFRELSPLISLFAISKMHWSKVKITETISLPLLAHKHPSTEGMGVTCPIPSPHMIPGSMIFISSAMFSTNLSYEKYCSPELVATEQWDDFALEIDREGRLARLR